MWNASLSSLSHVYSMQAYLPQTAQAMHVTMQRKEKEALKQSEETAEQGNVDASMTCAQQAEALNKQYEELLKQFTTPERTMSVCDVCGVFINSTDNDQRKAVSPFQSLCGLIKRCSQHVMKETACPLAFKPSVSSEQSSEGALSSIISLYLDFLFLSLKFCKNEVSAGDD